MDLRELADDYRKRLREDSPLDGCSCCKPDSPDPAAQRASSVNVGSDTASDSGPSES
jgi:hypothetical protein